MKEKVLNIIAESANIDVSEITPDMEFVKDLGINSVEFAELVFECENEFNVDSISTNLIEYSSLQENLMKSQNLITLSLKNENILKEAIVFTNKFKEYITTQLTKNISKAEENELQNANKEVSFHYILL